MQSHGFSTVPAHVQSIDTPNFMFAQVYSPGEYTRAHLDTWGHRFLAQNAKIGPSRAVARLLGCGRRPNSRPKLQHTYLHVLRKVTTALAYTHGKLEITGSFPAKNASLNVSQTKARPPLSGPGTPRLSPRLRQSLPLLPSRAWGNTTGGS